MKVLTLLYWPQLYFSTANKSSLNKLALIAVVQNISVVQHNRWIYNVSQFAHPDTPILQLWTFGALVCQNHLLVHLCSFLWVLQVFVLLKPENVSSSVVFLKRDCDYDCVCFTWTVILPEAAADGSRSLMLPAECAEISICQTECCSDVQAFQRIFFHSTPKSASCFFCLCGVVCFLPVVANQIDFPDKNFNALLFSSEISSN